jgi:hypothetical protein
MKTLEVVIFFFFFFLYNIIVIFGGRAFQMTDSIHMRTNCALLLLVDLFFYLFEADFLQNLLD